MRSAFLLSIVAGVALGLGYAWLIAPVVPTTADPLHVVEPYQEVWLITAAEAYATSGDWERTLARLNGLGDPNLMRHVVALFERYSGDGPNPQARALARLAAQLGAERTAAMQVYLATPITTPTIMPTATPRAPTPTSRSTDSTNVSATPTIDFAFPTPTATATPPPEFVAVSQTSVCEATERPQIRVVVQDAEGNGLPGVDVWITWNGGADRFVTGLKPEIGSGYGDFDMTPGVSYRIGAGTQTALALVSNLRAEPCSIDDNSVGQLSWEIVLSPAITGQATDEPSE
jgi:hypothetical protein